MVKDYTNDPNSNKRKNPLLIRSLFLKSGDKVTILTVQNKLYCIDENIDVSPLEMHAPWSRFVFYIIHDGKRETANIKAEDIPYIWERTKLCMAKRLCISHNVQPKEICYTVTLSGKKYGGKTPAQILLDNPDEKTGLYEQWKYLKQNANKYPRNSVMMDAIQQAIEKLQEGDLKEMPSPVHEIYRRDVKFLESIKDKDGRVLVYSIKITYTEGDMERPYSIEIINRYAFLQNGPGGTKVPQLKGAKDMSSATFNMTEEEWFKLIRPINDQVHYFESGCFFALYKEAVTMDQMFALEKQ